MESMTDPGPKERTCILCGKGTTTGRSLVRDDLDGTSYVICTPCLAGLFRNVPDSRAATGETIPLALAVVQPNKYADHATYQPAFTFAPTPRDRAISILIMSFGCMTGITLNMLIGLWSLFFFGWLAVLAVARSYRSISALAMAILTLGALLVVGGWL